MFRKKRGRSYPGHTDCGRDKMALHRSSGTWESLQTGTAFTKRVREGTVSAAEVPG